MNSAPEAGLASLLASRGRGGDTMLVHMGPEEVRGLQSIALAHGGSLTINPVTGMVEANFLKKLLPAIAGFTLNSLFPGMGTLGTSLLVGGATGLIEGDLKKGIKAGMGAYSGANIRQALAQAGQAAKAEAAKKLTGSTLPGASKADLDMPLGEDILEFTKPVAPPVTPTVTPPPALNLAQPKGILDRVGQSKFGQSDMGAGIMSLFRPGGGEQMVKYLGGPNKAGMTFAPIMSAIDEAEQERNARKMQKIAEGENYFYVPGEFNKQTGKFEPGRYIDAKGNPYTKPFKWGFADGGVVPTPNSNYPMARLQDNGLGGYDTPVSPISGQESPITNFAEGGKVDPLEEYYKSLLAPPSTTNPNQADIDANTDYVNEWNRIFAGGMRDFGGKSGSAASYYVPSTVVTPAAGTSAVPAGPPPAETIGETIKPEAPPVQEVTPPVQSGGSAGPAGTTITAPPPPPPPPPPKTATTSIEEIDPGTVIGGSGPVSESIIDAAPGAGGVKAPEEPKGEMTVFVPPENIGEGATGVVAESPDLQETTPVETNQQIIDKIAADLAEQERLAKEKTFAERALEYAKQNLPSALGTAIGGPLGGVIAEAIAKKVFDYGVIVPPENIAEDAAGVKSTLQEAQEEAAKKAEADRKAKEDAEKAAAEAAAAEAARREQEAREAAERAAYEASLVSDRGRLGVSSRATSAEEKRGAVTVQEINAEQVARETAERAAAERAAAEAARREQEAREAAERETARREKEAAEKAAAEAAKREQEAKEAEEKAAAEAAAAEAARREQEAREAAERAAYEASLAASQRGRGGSPMPLVPSLAAERGALGRAAGAMEKFSNESDVVGTIYDEQGNIIPENVDLDFGFAVGGPVADDYYNFGFAQGGLGALPEYKAGGKLLRGPGDGMSDDIPAVIRGAKVQRAALADGEFVIPADVVSHLGNGSTEAGAKKLYQMMDKIRVARTGNKRQGRQINPDKFLPV